MLGRDELLAKAEFALNRSKADETEVVIFGSRSYLTRFTGNRIHQNAGETSYGVTVRAVRGKRVGLSSCTSIDGSSIVNAVDDAFELAGLVPETPEFPGLPAPEPVPEVPGNYSRRTAECPPDLRAAYVSRIAAMAADKGLDAAGSFSTAELELVVTNSRGLKAYASLTRARLVTLVMSDNSSGYAEASAIDIGEIDPTSLAETAVEKCLMSRNPISVEPGEYDVILEEPAVSEMLLYLAFMGFSADSYQTGQSFMSGKIGQKITGENITIWDDGTDPSGFPMPFDVEGVPKKKVVLIENGVARGVVYSSLAAAREPGKKSTGHAIFPGMFPSCLPTNIFMAPGNASREDMLGSVEKGLLVTRFHYVNIVHPLLSSITGMTRDGTFLIRNGKIVSGTRNLRFTQSILEALARCDAISNCTKLFAVEGGLAAVRCPSVRIRGFNFTGATEF
ncbi:MAG: TldD/PmbA family protein [Firmicutes bacterium]|nr:TldD/PmbA family protein [Candidatus Fermentithermobacillaceae bacterium]